MSNPLFNMFNGGKPQSIIGNNPQIAALAQMAKGGPQAMMAAMMQGNPQMQNILSLAKTKSPQELEMLCRQQCQQQGIDFNQLVNELKQYMQ